MNPLLAFGFASPLMLGGLLLGGIPILIHLLHKRRYKETPWAAMRFLIAATKKNSRRLRLEQLLLLAVRTLILILLVLALARPFVESFGTYFQADAPTHRIIVLDMSYSMGYRLTDQSHFERGREVAREIVAHARQGDALNLVRISGSPPRVIIRRPAYQKSSVLDEIDQLELPDERGSVLESLEEVEELLEDAPEIPQKEIYFITDLQQESWTPPVVEDNLRLRRSLARLGEAAALNWIDVGETGAVNAAVADLAAEEPFVTVGRPVHLRVMLRNHGDATLPGQLLELFADGRLVENRRIDLPPASETQADFTHTFVAAGNHELEVRLEEDALPVDNSRRLLLPVKDDLQVLLVNGKLSGEAMGNATDYLRLALAPSVAERQTSSLIRPRVINEGELPAVDLSRYDCVFLCNVALFTVREAEILHSYLTGGGGVVFCLGDQVRPESYNRILYRDGEGILPASIGDRIGNAEAKREIFDFDAGDFAHPIVRPFQGNPNSGLEATKTFEYFRTSVVPDRQARVALRFSSGDPAIVEMPVGRGRAVLITTSVDREWSTWAVWGHSLIPLMHETVAHTVADRWRDRSVIVGAPFARSFATRAGRISATVTTPAGQTEAFSVDAVDGVVRVVYEGARRAGIYRLQVGPPVSRSETFVVNVDPREGNLGKLDDEDLRSDLLADTDYQYFTQWHNVERTADAAVPQRGGLTRWLLTAVVCLLLVEQAMAWNFFAGVVLLYLAAGAALARAAFLGGPLYGLVMLLIVAAGLLALLRLGARGRGAPFLWSPK